MTKFEFGGLIGDRIKANVQNWLVPLPSTNPGILNMFRDRGLSNGLLWWSGEFAGKYLISAVQSIRLTQDQELKKTIKKFVHDLIGYQEPDGYLGPFSGDER